MRPEIQSLRRAVPEDFTVEQRSTFAVFSGSGVGKLKRALFLIWSEQHGRFPDFDYEF
jgi:hypothetical protein